MIWVLGFLVIPLVSHHHVLVSGRTCCVVWLVVLHLLGSLVVLRVVVLFTWLEVVWNEINVVHRCRLRLEPMRSVPSSVRIHKVLSHVSDWAATSSMGLGPDLIWTIWVLGMLLHWHQRPFLILRILWSHYEFWIRSKTMIFHSLWISSCLRFIILVESWWSDFLRICSTRFLLLENPLQTINQILMILITIKHIKTRKYKLILFLNKLIQQFNIFLVCKVIIREAVEE